VSADDLKRAAGEAAAQLVETGMTVGLGTGSTAACFVKALAARRLDVRGVATSQATAVLARGLGIEIVDLDQAGEIDLTVDGADEIGPGLDLIKGAGAALLREKLVWEASAKCVVVADASKRVERLGRSPLPIEVVAFGHVTTAARIEGALKACGIDAAPVLRVGGGRPVVTDSGNLIYDAACGAIEAPADLARGLKGLTGVVEHGLFLGLAGRALIAADHGMIDLWS
jgi:ribose 5-phosphate isomerase A